MILRYMALSWLLFTMGLAGAPLMAKDSLTLGMALEPTTLDPTATAAAATDEIVYANIFEGLTRIDRNGTVQPALAQRWDISDDGKVYTFYLHHNARFHDGTALDSEDVAFSFNRARAENSTNAQKWLFDAIESVEAVDPLTVRIALSRAQGDFLFRMAWGDAVIVAPETAAKNASQPVGTGPYRLAKWVRGSHIELSAHNNYWGEKPAIKRATFKFISDPAAALSALLAGDVDGFDNFPAPENLKQLEVDPRFKVVIGTTEGETILAMNHARGPLQDKRVRQAIAYALDRQAIIDGAMFGYGAVIGSHFPPHHPAYVDLTGMYAQNLDKARALLAEAGFADGLQLTLKLPPPTYARRGGEIIAAQLKQIGVTVEMIPVEWALWLEQVFHNKDYDLTIVSHTEPMDIGIYARDDYYFNYSSPAFNKIMADLEQTSDEAARIALLQNAQRQLAEDAVNGFLFQLAKHGVWNAKLEGLWANSPIQANDLRHVRWRE